MSSEQPVPAPASTAVPTAGSGVPSSGRLPGRDWSGWVWLGWLVAHLIPVIWIGIAGTSTGDVKYYFSGVTDRDARTLEQAAGAMVDLGGNAGYANGFRYAMSLR